MTKTETIAAMLAELIETHMAKCANEVPHIVSERHNTAADILHIRSGSLMAGNSVLVLELSDGSEFSIAVGREP